MGYKKSICFFLICLAAAGGLLLPASSARAEGLEHGELVERIRQAAPPQRGRKAQELAAERGEDIVPQIIDVLERHQQYKDKHFVAACITALANIGSDADNATDALLAVLDVPSAKITYSAARTLGYIWKGRGGEDSENVRKVNTRLLSYAIIAEGAEKYGPGLALVRINDIDVGEGGGANLIARAQAEQPDRLTRQIYMRLARTPDRLLAMDHWPWPLLVQRYLMAPDSEEGARARELLEELSPLESVGYLLERMQVADPESAVWQTMAELMVTMTGIDLNIAEARESNDIAEFLADWQLEWYGALKERKDEKHKAFTWRLLEDAIKSAKFDAFPEDFERLDILKETIIHQYDSPDDIPDDASDTSAKLLREKLNLKLKYLQAMEDFDSAADDIAARLREVQKIQDMAQPGTGREIGALFLDELVNIAREENNPRVLSGLSNALTSIGGIPLSLAERREAREARLEEWLEDVKDLRGL